MADYLHKTRDPVDYRPSVGTTTLDDTASADPVDVAVNWFKDPDISAVAAVPQKYWARPLTDPVTEMTQPEKDAVDAAIAAAELAVQRADAVARRDLDISLRSIFEGWLFEVNKCNTRLQELQDTLTAIKNTSGGSDNIRAAIPDPSATSNPAPAAFSNVNPKLRSQVLQKYVDDINAGTADP